MNDTLARLLTVLVLAGIAGLIIFILQNGEGASQPLQEAATRVGTPALFEPVATKAATMAPATPTETGLLAAAPTRPARTGRPESVGEPSKTPTTVSAAGPDATLTPTNTPVYSVHVVSSGETLLGISLEYGVATEAIVDINRLADPNRLAAGQSLRIPAPTAGNALPVAPTRDYGYRILGYSVEGRAIEAFSFGNGDNHIVFVGAIHGGYEWNTALLAFAIIDFLNGNRDRIPESLTVHVVPVANPDGLHAVTGSAGRFFPNQVAAETRAGRFNGRNVDLNRNWECGWSANARWGGRNVNPGSAPFSEPETRALRDFFRSLAPRAVVFWHSAIGLVAAGICGGDSGSNELAKLYGEAAGYPVGPFTAYALSGTASDWLNGQGIPAVAVELWTHDEIDYGPNLAGVLAVLEQYGRGQ